MGDLLTATLSRFRSAMSELMSELQEELLT